MLISNIDDLQSFLSKWYGLNDISLTSDIPEGELKLPDVLTAAWKKIGLLSVGYNEWQKTGSSAPLACQDGLAAPGQLVRRDGYVQVVFENQGNWAIGYKEKDQASDPEVYSDFLEQEIGGTGFISVGCRLSELIITSALTETIFFGSINQKEALEIVAECDRLIWTGHYYNAIGFGEQYEKPSHEIRASQDAKTLALYWNDKFSGYLAKSSFGHERLHQLSYNFP